MSRSDAEVLLPAKREEFRRLSQKFQALIESMKVVGAEMDRLQLELNGLERELGLDLIALETT